LRYQKAWMLIQFARNYEIVGDTSKQLARALAAQSLLAGLTGEKPDDRTYQRDLAVADDEVGNVLVAQGKLDEALKSYRDNLAIAERVAASDRSNAQWQNDLQHSTDRIGSLAYKCVLARNFARALEASDLVISLSPDQIWLHTNRAHALMFLGRVEEARALYLRYRGGKMQNGKPWETVVLEDFGEMRNAGLTHPLMDEIEKRFAAGG